MISRLTALVLTLIMGVPLCLCCTTATAAVASPEAEICAACRYLDEADAEHAPKDNPHQDRRCCAKSNVRTLSPDNATAPRLVLVDLQAPVWSHPEFLPPVVWLDVASPAAAAPDVPSWRGPALYQKHCALLL